MGAFFGLRFSLRHRLLLAKHLKKKAKFDNNDDEDGAINHDGATNPPWDGAMAALTHISKTKSKEVVKIVKAEGGLPLEVAKVRTPNHERADEDDKPSLEFNVNQPKEKPITREDKKVVNMEEKINMEIPNLNEMPEEEKTLFLSTMLDQLAKNKNPDTMKMLQHALEASRIDAMNPEAALPAHPEALPADPNKASNGCTKVDLDSSDDPDDDSKSENGDAFCLMDLERTVMHRATAS